MATLESLAAQFDGLDELHAEWALADEHGPLTDRERELLRIGWLAGRDHERGSQRASEAYQEELRDRIENAAMWARSRYR